MDNSRQLLLGLTILGLSSGLASAADPAPQAGKGTAPSAAIKAPAANDPKKAPPSPDLAPSILPPTEMTAPAFADDPCCLEGVRRAGLIGGAGVAFLQPYFDNNVAYAVQATANRSGGAIPPGAPGTRALARVDVNHHFEAAPELWLGYMSESGIGGRARWWYFREGTEQAVTAPTGQGPVNIVNIFSAAPLGLSLTDPSTMVATTKLEFQVTDFEALYELESDKWNFLFCGGVRVAWIDQAYNAYTRAVGRNTVLSSNTFQGIGPTLALETRRELGSSGLALFADTRGSMVFGGASQIAVKVGQNEAAQEHRDVGTAVGEVELGVEFGRGLRRSWFYSQVAVVGQQWFGAGSSSRSSVAALPGLMINQAPYTGDSDIALFGLAVRLGVNY